MQTATTIRFCTQERTHCLIVALATFLLVAPAAVPQSTTSDVVLTALSKPGYPSMAHVAQIAGDVKVEVRIRPDGSMESAAALSGHPLLLSSAVESAKRSKFECRGCTGTTAYILTYTFQITPRKSDPCCCTQRKTPEGNSTDNWPKLSHTQDHITLTAGPICVCPDSCGFADRYRSAKCLYLWKCGVHPEL